MPQQDLGLMNDVGKFFGKGKKEEKPAPKKVDTSWHDKMVKDANEAFQKQSTQKVSGGDPKTQTPTKTAAKPATRKRISGKR